MWSQSTELEAWIQVALAAPFGSKQSQRSSWHWQCLHETSRKIQILLHFPECCVISLLWQYSHSGLLLAKCLGVSTQGSTSLGVFTQEFISGSQRRCLAWDKTLSNLTSASQFIGSLGNSFLAEVPEERPQQKPEKWPQRGAALSAM